ncbi:hypothetical protein ES703_120443 [subsurface metagenome]
MINEVSSNPILTNCIFSSNLADHRGGGMYNSSSSPTVVNCTFSGNSAGYYGGGILCHYNSDPTISNCILWGDTAGMDGAEIALSSPDYPSTLTISYSDVAGGEAAAYVETNCTLN